MYVLVSLRLFDILKILLVLHFNNALSKILFNVYFIEKAYLSNNLASKLYLPTPVKSKPT